MPSRAGTFFYRTEPTYMPPKYAEWFLLSQVVLTLNISSPRMCEALVSCARYLTIARAPAAFLQASWGL